MKQSIRIRENNVLAIETRKNLYILAQSLGRHTLIFFNCFNEDLQQFNDVDLNKVNILCCITPVKQFFQKSNIVKININPLIIIKDYKRQNHLTFELIPTWKEYIIYNGTKDEIKFNYSEGDLRLVNWKAETIKEIDIKTDKEIIEKHQWDTMGMYGELNEKLYLSYKYGKYIEPLKDLVLGNKLPIDYKIYFLICAGKITEDEWLKL